MSPTVFQKALFDWSRQHPRPLPWKGIQDPYKIWLSEIILQQTRVEQGRPYYEKFIDKYPRIQDLAAAPDDEVFKYWEGLGYYSRCRNLLHTARYITDYLHGKFPDKYEDILKLKGIGEYTAAAIASFAFGLPHAVLDGNVYRVLARCWGISTPTDTSTAKIFFKRLSQELLDRNTPAAYNQAIMDFGATCCTPQNPQCEVCPLQTHCVAYKQETVQQLPLKSVKSPKKERYFLFFVLKKADHVLVAKRQGKDIWHGLWQFPLLELDRPSWLSLNPDLAEKYLFEHFISLDWQGSSKIIQLSSTFQQILTHQILMVTFFEVHLPLGFDHLNSTLFNHQFFSVSEIASKVAFPKVIDRYWQGH